MAVGDDLILVASNEALVDLIPTDATTYQAVLGGSPFNTAVGVGRLNVPCGFAGCLSTDSMGERFLARLVESGVDTSFCTRDSAPSALAFVTRGTETTGARYAFYLGSTAYDAPAPLPQAWPGRVSHLHIGSFSATEGTMGAACLQAFKAAHGKVTLSYDPNIRPLVMRPPAETAVAVEERVALSTLVKVSDEDMVWLYPSEDPHVAAAAWAKRGPRLVVLTRGGSGAVGFFNGRQVERQAPVITVADTVGAGDSFMAALMATMIGDGALGRAALDNPVELAETQVDGWLSYAVAAAAITCTRKGANPPTRDEMRQAVATVIPTA